MGHVARNDGRDLISTSPVHPVPMYNDGLVKQDLQLFQHNGLILSYYFVEVSVAVCLRDFDLVPPQALPVIHETPASANCSDQNAMVVLDYLQNPLLTEVQQPSLHDQEDA